MTLGRDDLDLLEETKEKSPTLSGNIRKKCTQKTGPNQELAIKLIKRMKGLFEEKLGITFDSKETVSEDAALRHILLITRMLFVP